MKIYLAARYDQRDRMLGIRDVLTAMGHTITSTWIDNKTDGFKPSEMNTDPGSSSPHAQRDMDEVLESDAIAVFTAYGRSLTGGRQVELGIALAAGKRILLIGPRENIFQTLTHVEQHESWERLVIALARRERAHPGREYP